MLKLLKDFHMGYDLLKAGYNYFAANEPNEINTELINGIANDFFEASIAKAGIAVYK